MIIHVNNPIQRASWGGEKLKISVQESSLSAGFFSAAHIFWAQPLAGFFFEGWEVTLLLMSDGSPPKE